MDIVIFQDIYDLKKCWIIVILDQWIEWTWYVSLSLYVYHASNSHNSTNFHVEWWMLFDWGIIIFIMHIGCIDQFSFPIEQQKLDAC